MNSQPVKFSVPVSIAARDWKVTPRRIRHLLTGGRLEGRQGANGIWEVSHPYCFTLGTHGTSSKRVKISEQEAETGNISQ